MCLCGEGGSGTVESSPLPAAGLAKGFSDCTTAAPFTVGMQSHCSLKEADNSSVICSGLDLVLE